LLLGWGWWLAGEAPIPDERWFRWGPPALLIVGGAMLTEQSGLWRGSGGWAVAVGDSSYSLYLLHPVLFYFANGVVKRLPGVTALPGELLVACAMVACVLLSRPAYQLIELPLTRLAQDVLRTRLSTASVAQRAKLTPKRSSANNA
jgi:peptidoglycan/LPS O-acetylase OafA/YrhL